MDERIAIVSDLHLGRQRWCAPSAAAIRPLWQGMTHLIVNGDCAEMHHPRHRERAAEEVLRLHDLCREDGVTLLLLSGNHDPHISGVRHLHLANGRVFVTHGDAIHRAVAPWSPAAGAMRAAREAALADVAAPTRNRLESILDATRHAALAELALLERESSHSSLRAMLMRPWTIAQVAWYWHVFPRLAGEFAHEHAPRAGVFLFGHTHHRGVWRVDGRTIVNTGSFGFPGKPYVAVVEGDAVRIHDAPWREDRYERGALVESLPLPSVDCPPSAASPAAATGTAQPPAASTRLGSVRPSAAAR